MSRVLPLSDPQDSGPYSPADEVTGETVRMPYKRPPGEENYKSGQKYRVRIKRDPIEVEWSIEADEQPGPPLLECEIDSEADLAPTLEVDVQPDDGGEPQLEVSFDLEDDEPPELEVVFSVDDSTPVLETTFEAVPLPKDHRS